jgi:hypothetical protein
LQASDRHPVTKEFMVLVAATPSATEVNEILHTLDHLEPLELLDAQLIPAAKSQLRAVEVAHRRSVHPIWVDFVLVPSF